MGEIQVKGHKAISIRVAYKRLGHFCSVVEVRMLNNHRAIIMSGKRIESAIYLIKSTKADVYYKYRYKRTQTHKLHPQSCSENQFICIFTILSGGNCCYIMQT